MQLLKTQEHFQLQESLVHLLPIQLIMQLSEVEVALEQPKVLAVVVAVVLEKPQEPAQVLIVFPL